MTDISASGLRHERERTRPSLEYNLYFGLIFALALPFGFAGWLRGLAGRGGPGPVARASAEAHRITPIIFWA